MARKEMRVPGRLPLGRFSADIQLRNFAHGENASESLLRQIPDRTSGAKRVLILNEIEPIWKAQAWHVREYYQRGCKSIAPLSDWLQLLNQKSRSTLQGAEQHGECVLSSGAVPAAMAVASWSR